LSDPLSAVQLNNHTSALEIFGNISERYEKLFEEKKFLDKYLENGMQEEELSYAIDDYIGLKRDYEEVGMDCQDGEEDEEEEEC